MGKKTDPDIDFLMLDDTSYSKLSFILLNSSSEISPLTYLFFNISNAESSLVFLSCSFLSTSNSFDLFDLDQILNLSVKLE